MGEERSKNLIQLSNFPWLCSNLKTIDGEQVAGTKEYHIIKHKGLKIGFIGLCEKEWIETLSCFEIEDLIYNPFIEAAEYFTKFLSSLLVK